MRRNPGIRVAVVLALSGWATTGEGQQPYWQRPERARQAASDAPQDAPDAWDQILSPYGGSARGPRAANERAYSRTPPPKRVETARASASASSRNYFPGMRLGQGPNRNYIPPERLCVPGRRAVLAR